MANFAEYIYVNPTILTYISCYIGINGQVTNYVCIKYIDSVISYFELLHISFEAGILIRYGSHIGWFNDKQSVLPGCIT
jgi:hypothetical protein